MKTSLDALQNIDIPQTPNHLLDDLSVDYYGNPLSATAQIEKLLLVERVHLSRHAYSVWLQSQATPGVVREPDPEYEAYRAREKQKFDRIVSELPEVIVSDNVADLAKLLALQQLIHYGDILGKVPQVEGTVTAVTIFNSIYRGDVDTVGFEYRKILEEMVRVDGVRGWIFNVDPTEYNSDYGFGQEEAHRNNMPDKWPLGAMVLLDYLYKHKEKPNSLPENLRQYLPLAEHIVARKQELMENEVAAQYPDVQGRLKQLIEYTPEVGMRTEKIIHNLMMSADKLAAIFPKQLTESTRAAFLDVTLASVYGILEHYQQGATTHGAIKLGENVTLPFTLEEDEPIRLLETLNVVVNEIFETVNDDQTQMLFAVKQDDYNIIRYIRDGKSKVVSYVRPFGGTSFNPSYEYGNTKGVEASIGYTLYVDEDFGVFDKRRGGNGAISIRIDREGLNPLVPRQPLANDRDPTREVGNLSLDVGSILGDEDSYGTRLGRFLAWSNVLQSEQVTRLSPTLNHAPERFPVGAKQDFAAALNIHLQAIEHDPRLVKSPRQLKKLFNLISR